MNTTYARFSHLCGQDGWLQHSAALVRSANVSADMQNIGGGFFHPMGKVIGIADISSLLPSEW